MFIPGQLISLITFIGVIVHEAAHQFFCRLMRVPVFEVKYFRFGNPAGYVLHEKTDKPLTNLLISIGPFFVNTVVGCLIMVPTSVEILVFKNYTNPFTLFMAWLGISILMHSFPSTGDARALIDTVLKNRDVNIIIKILVAPIIGLIYVGAIGSIFWLDLLYAIGVSMLLPNIIVGFMN